MQISAIKLAFGVSVLFHGLAFSVVSWGLGNGAGDSRAPVVQGADRVLEIILEPEIVVPEVLAAPLAVAPAIPDLAPPPEIVAPVRTERVSPPTEVPQKLVEPALGDSLCIASKVEAAHESPSLALVLPPESTRAPGQPQAVCADTNACNHDVLGSGESASGGEGVSSVARYLSNPKPFYPRLARQRRQQGLVLLDVAVTADGLAADVRVKQSSRFELLDDAAMGAVRQWRFTPAQKGNRPIACQIEVPVRFKIAG
jgi:protein TonB